MTHLRRDHLPTLHTRDNFRPRSPAEALEPGRAPPRPRGVKDRRQSKVVSGFARVVSGLMTVALVAMLSAGGLTLLSKHLYERQGPLTVAQTAVIPRGSTSNEIAERLEKEGVISSRWAFMVSYLAQSRLGDGEVVLKHGEYLFKPGASIRDVIATLADGKSLSHKITIPEGLTSHEIVARLKAEDDLVGEVAIVPPEGSLLPETYAIEKGMERQELIDRMAAKHKQVLEALWAKKRPDVPLKTPAEAVVLASVIEKETGRADERERIAGVFTNRLKKNMPLQSDPTILYGIYGGAVEWGKPIMQAEKETKNAHNTYQMRGLPTTPICNVGRAALEAALDPADTKDIYFVADGTGGHIFSATLQEHNAAVTNWRKVEREMRARQAAEAKDDAADAEGPAATATAPAAPADEIPSPAAEPAATPGKAAAPAPVTAATAGVASTIPLPVRKPKR